MLIVASPNASNGHLSRSSRTTARATSTGLVLITALALAGLFSAFSLQPAFGLTCPVAHPARAHIALKETKKDIQELSMVLAAQGATVVPDIIGRLRQQFPRAKDAELTNYLVTLYCPVINRNVGLREAAKRSRLINFSS